MHYKQSLLHILKFSLLNHFNATVFNSQDYKLKFSEIACKLQSGLFIIYLFEWPAIYSVWVIVLYRMYCVCWMNNDQNAKSVVIHVLITHWLYHRDQQTIIILHAVHINIRKRKLNLLISTDLSPAGTLCFRVVSSSISFGDLNISLK